MANTEDFSFPKLTNTNTNQNNNNNALSLWRISSLVYPDQEEEEENEEKEEDQFYGVVRKHKSFSEIEVGDSETRMDLLWEDFNEKELQRVSSSDNRIKTRRRLSIITTSDNNCYNIGNKNENDNDNNHCGYFHDIGDPGSKNFVQGSSLKLKVSKRSSLVKQPKRTSTVVLLRALRKLFSLHNLARNKKNN